MPDFIKSSESLEHDQLGKRRWHSGSPSKSSRPPAPLLEALAGGPAARG